MRKKWKILLVILLLSSSVAIGTYYKWRATFTVEKWNTHIWKREYMMDDLVEKYGLVGMSKNEVRTLLGSEGLMPGHAFGYYVGKSFMGPVLLLISFDDDGKVSRYGIVVD